MKDLRLHVKKANQLWLKWRSIEKDGNGLIHLKNAEFYGPVLQDYTPMEGSGHILLDFTSHFLVLIPKPYIVKVSWNKILSQEADSIKIADLLIEDYDLGHLNKVTSSDQILLDCTDHTTEAEAKGIYKMAYQSMLYKSDLSPYDFHT